MADPENQVTIIVDDEQPIAVRRGRRSSSIQSPSSSKVQVSIPFGISTPPATPKRTKKRVRFSDPGPEILETESASSGLTPFIRKTSISTPSSRRRHSTPATLSNRAAYNDAPLSGTLQFAPLRQVLDGRVKRRLRRNRLSEEINIIEWEKRDDAKKRKTEIERLKEELAAKDLEVQSMRDEQEIASQLEGESGLSLTTNTTQSTKIQELEQVITELKAELQRKSVEPEDGHDWTMAARDPFDFDDDDDHMITNYDDDFSHIDDMQTTPTRLNTSFPSPPSTLPNTPCKSVSSVSAGIQASLPIPDPEKEALKSQLDALNSEISKLTSAIAFKDDTHARLTDKLSSFIPINESQDHSTLDSALDSVLTALALAQSHASEKEHAFSALSTEISSLGFPSTSGPEEALELIRQQFRRARLDLEYLTPGENEEGFENAKLLDMLVSRIRVLVARVKEQDASIDEYHEQELSLRQQLNTRVSVMDALQKELREANEKAEEVETGNERLKEALEGYRNEVKGLEELVSRMERQEEGLRSEMGEIQERLQLEEQRHDATRASDEGKDMTIVELERRLAAALEAASEVQAQLTALGLENKEKESAIEHLKTSSLEREVEHGNALALRDARVTELREEVSRVNTALKNAHANILSLKRENRELEAQVAGEKTRGMFVVQSMQDQLKRALETGLGYVNGDVSVHGPIPATPALEEGNNEPVIRRGSFLDGSLARKSGKKRRRYDSGLGFLEEEDDGDMESML